MQLQTIAFGGYAYSIAKWLPKDVVHHSCPWYGFTDARCRKIAREIVEPTKVIGFSAGAEAALRVAWYCPLVREAIIHSVLDNFTKYRRDCVYRFYRTKDDTTPTFQGTLVSAMLAPSGSSLKTLDMKDFDNPTWFERTQLQRRNHIFHNLPGLE